MALTDAEGAQEDRQQEDVGGDEEVGAAGPDCESTTNNEKDVPELLDLIDAVEEAGEDAHSLVAVLHDIGSRLRVSPEDRDLLSDFDGIAHICKFLAGPLCGWQGEPMLTFCRMMPDICRMSKVNRGTLRDEGFVAAAVEFLRNAVKCGDELAAIAASIALNATCTGNDGNKRLAAALHPIERDVATDETSEDLTDDIAATKKSGALILLLDALARFPDSGSLQAEAISALRALVSDDDRRDADCEPAAVENRSVIVSDEGFPFFGAAIERALTETVSTGKLRVKLREQSLLVVREMARRQDRVEALASGAKLLPHVLSAVDADDARLVRAGLAVLRAFVIIEDIRDELAIMSDGAERCVAAVSKHMATPAVSEQGFGLFANLTMRKSSIASKLNDGERGVVALGLAALRLHSARPDAIRSIIHTLRNVSAQDDAACEEVKSRGVFEEVRALVLAHEGESRWKASVDISRQFLREHRADEGMEKAAKYNAFY